MTPSDFQRIGKLLYGERNWFGPMAAALKLHKDTVKKASYGHKAYRGVLEDAKPKVLILLQKKAKKLQKQIDHYPS